MGKGKQKGDEKTEEVRRRGCYYVTIELEPSMKTTFKNQETVLKGVGGGVGGGRGLLKGSFS